MKEPCFINQPSYFIYIVIMDLTNFLKDQMAQSLSPAIIDQISQQLGTPPEQTSQAASSAMSVLLTSLARNAATPTGAEALNNALERDNHGSILDVLGGLLGGGAQQQAPAKPAGMDLGGLLGGLMGGGQKTNSQAGGIDLGGLLGGLMGSGGGQQSGGMDMGSILGSLLGGAGGSSKAANGAAILGHILGRRTEDTAAQIGQNTGIGTGNTLKLMAMLAPIVMGMLGKTKKAGGLNAEGLGGLLDGFMRTNVQPGKPAAETNLGLAGRILDRDGDGSAIDDIAGMIGGFLSRR